MRILVGTDGSVGGQAALRWAIELALANGGELLIASVWRPVFAEVSNDELEVLRAEADDRLGDWCRPARDAGVDWHATLVEGDPRERLLAVAEAERTDLVVVGARGMGGHTHALHVGSVTHHLVHHTTRAIAAIPEATRPVWPAAVVVGIDGSEGSLGAVAWCATLGPEVAREVIAVHAAESAASRTASDPRGWYEAERERSEAWVVPLRRAGVTNRTVVVDGNPVRALTDTAISARAGLLVVGARGLGGVSGLRLGSTALKVLHQGHLPVIMVPAGAE